MNLIEGLSPFMRAIVAERDAEIARAKAEGRTALHRKYCMCSSSWTADYRDPGCIYFDRGW
ncbi:hypothetical protein SEA_ECLIPTUS_90 [Gordonia phage Ecliptus]|nr:hypothetical protein SEA_ECLIPTUS_90 [Gordonia phage Ecliptus]